MPNGVRGQVLVDSAQFLGNCLSSYYCRGWVVEFLYLCSRGYPYTFEYLSGNAQKWNTVEVICLFMGFHYPLVAVAVL